MNNQEAKFRLSAYRPGGDDASDPAMIEALEQARRDPELGAWLERERVFDAAVAAKLSGIAPPAGLRAAILSGSRVSARRPWWRSPALMALAACVTVAIGGGLIAFRARGGVPGGLVALAVQDMLHGHHEGLIPQLAPFQGPLASPSAALDKGMPFDSSKLGAADCRSLSFHGHKVFELCFLRGGLVFHLYVMPLEGSRASGPVYSSADGLSTASWTDASHAYVLATKLGISALEKVIQGG
ncbi:hypothetical protein GALL_104280 [mine drainage metagenome]|uniref:Transmembrane transcriptional regulator (Anti-sigma factor) n=1 Tax=mine drainage metagenome TaxID=410659 RepID=A0A1J5STW5_9ZZZZ